MALWDLMDLLLNPSYDKDYPHQMEAVRKRVASVAERELIAFAKEGEPRVTEPALAIEKQDYIRQVQRAAAEAGYIVISDYVEPRKVARVRIRVKPPRVCQTGKARTRWWHLTLGSRPATGYIYLDQLRSRHIRRIQDRAKAYTHAKG